jgi:hypothetical protein
VKKLLNCKIYRFARSGKQEKEAMKNNVMVDALKLSFASIAAIHVPSAKHSLLRGRRQIVAMALTLLAIAFSAGTYAQTPKKQIKVGDAPGVIWREPTDITTRNLFWGPGGEKHAPKGKLTFTSENLKGINAKINATDENGIKWGIKFGNEAKPETAATRLVWAVGYFTNEDYYFPELPSKGLFHLSRGEEYISNNKLHEVRLKRHNKGEHEIADWSWDQNPFVGTRELNGLKIMMEIICNTDLKKVQQHVYDIKGVEQRYVAADIGASFGRAGKTVGRTKGVLKDYNALPLIKNAGPDYIDFWHFKHIPRADAKWIGGWLTQLSDAQVSDCFRAAGFSTEDTAGFTRKVREKINELTSL